MIYEFEGFRLNATNHRLFRRESGELVPLTPKAAQLLIFLVQNKDRVLTKDELLETVWNDSIVEESNLSQTIFVLRKTLGENTKEPRFIRTVPNQGYQFIGAVTEVNAEKDPAGPVEGAGEAPMPRESGPKSPTYFLIAFLMIMVLVFGVYWFYPAPKPASVSEIRSMAVLPFEDLSTEQSEKYLGASLADALANKFGGLRQITVRPTRAVLKYADSREDASKIGRDLQVDAVLDGRIQRDGTRIRVSVQLIRTSDNATIWTENFDDEFTNFFAVQDSISRKVVQSLALQLDEKERAKIGRHGTENVEAYQQYLRGRFFWNKRTSEGLQKAIENFNRAVELDPNFAQARSGLAETYVLINLFGARHDPNALPTAKDHALRALELDGSLAEAHAALAQVKMQYDFDWPGTESEYLKAIELDPNDATVRQWYGEFLALQGRTDESLAQMEMARDLDPTSLSTSNAMALPLLRGKQTDKALAVIEKVLEMDPNFPWALHYQCRAFLQKGEVEKAVESCQRALAASNQSIFMKSNLAYALVRARREPEARQILESLEDMARSVYVSPYNFAVIYNALGDRTAAIKYLNQAIDERDFLVPALKGDTSFSNLQDDPQFAEVLQRVNL